MSILYIFFTFKNSRSIWKIFFSIYFCNIILLLFLELHLIF